MRTDLFHRGPQELLAVGLFGDRSQLGNRVETLLRRGRTFSTNMSAGRAAVSLLVLGAMLLASALAPRVIAFAQHPSFEVVSIKPHPGEIAYASNSIRGNRYRGVAITLIDLMTDAYGVLGNQVSGGPAWISTEHFDVDTRAPGDDALAWENARPMLQAMLAERFKLKVRRENKDVPAFDLVIARGGPKFKMDPGKAAASRDFVTHVDSLGTGIKATKATMRRLTIQLAVSTGRPVVDKTGLDALYDFELKWARDNSPAEVDGSAPMLFPALEEQLGLKLQPSRAMQEMLIIESAEKPDAN